MAFKMKGYQAHDKSPMKVGGKWSNWTADRQKFIGDEIEARRKKFLKMEKDAKKLTNDKGKGKDKDKDKDKDTTTTKDTKGRVEFADANPELQKYVQQKEGKVVDGVYQPGEKYLKDYETAFNDMENKTVDGRTMKYNPENKKYYEDSKEGMELFTTDAETWYKKHHEKDKSKNLNIDSQTDKQSTHKVWD